LLNKNFMKNNTLIHNPVHSTSTIGGFFIASTWNAFLPELR
jgi:hypothetical protein